ncbi:MAG TPA: hypothetical protein VKN14_01930, partial [Flavobacteriaceae bacterium]|nr:hypothetical protein [Flavobacteriaceae bacterium]
MKTITLFRTIALVLVLQFSIKSIAQTPTTPSSNLVVNSVGTDNIDISFTPGNGSNRLIVVTEGDYVDSSDQGIFSFYEEGTKPYETESYYDGSFNTIGYVVYFGPQTDNITLSGFSPDTTYYITIFEVSLFGDTLYNNVLEGTATTTALITPTVQASFTSLVADATTMTINFASGDG